MVNSRHREYIFTQESFYLQGILDDMNEQDTPFLECKHKHMMKSGAPSDKVGVLHRLLPIKFTELISKGYHTHWFLVLSQYFIDGMGPLIKKLFHFESKKVSMLFKV